jgi:hypothetical protein
MQKVEWWVWDAAELVGVRVYAMLRYQSRPCLSLFSDARWTSNEQRRGLAAICCQIRPYR